MINQLTIVGRVTRDPEIKFTDSGSAVAKFSVAVDQAGKRKGDTDKTDFFDVEVWQGAQGRKQAEFAAEWVKRGQFVAVTGRHESRKHNEKTYWTLKATDIDPFLGAKASNNEAPAATSDEPILF